MAAISRLVAIGRRMKCPEIFTPSPLLKLWGRPRLPTIIPNGGP
jgi:hypothetical protein